MHSRFLPLFKRSWSAMLNLGFGLLCIRYLFAVGLSGNLSLVMLGVASFALGWWRPAASLFALILSFSLLSGLERTVLHVPYSAVLTIASSIWLGLTARKLFTAPSPAGPRIEPAGSSRRAASWMMLIVEVLATIALLALCVQVWRQNTTPEFWTRFWHQAHYGPGDPAYFLTSGFLWLHGLFYLRVIREHPASDIVTPAGIKLTFLVNGIILLLFHGVQWLFELPTRWNPGFASPYEDIATFGIMAVCFLIVCLTLLGRDQVRWMLVSVPGALLLAIAVCASWSRGSWLVCATFLNVIALLRLPRSVALFFPVALFGAVVFLNINAGKIPLTNHLDRLISLVRFENLETKALGRFGLYHKAWAMIQEHPWTGHGIGSFFRKATNYAQPGDPYASLNHFPHNILLHFAVEQGVPAALLFVGFVGWTVCRGARCWLGRTRSRTLHGHDGQGPIDPMAPLIMGLTLALMAYIQANMTWDILLVHPTQPFFFWFMVAALWASIERADDTLGIPAKNLG